MTIDIIVRFLMAVIRVSTPLIFGALAACVTRKAGLLNLAIESMMLSSALAGGAGKRRNAEPILGLDSRLCCRDHHHFDHLLCSFCAKMRSVLDQYRHEHSAGRRNGICDVPVYRPEGQYIRQHRQPRCGQPGHPSAQGHTDPWGYTVRAQCVHLHCVFDDLSGLVLSL